MCVAPELGRGFADYSRFVRRHAHLHAPCEDGTIETGPSHVHPELSPYGPPAAERFVAINLEQQERAGDRDAARDRWGIGEPYRGVDLDVLVVRDPRRAGGQGQAALADVRPQRSRRQTVGAAAGLAAAVALAAAGAPLAVGAVALLAAAAAIVWARGVARRAHPVEIPLEWAAGAVCDAYVALGELTPEVARTMSFSVRPEGWVRVSLPDADPEISRHVSAALDELYGGGALARYVVSRKVMTRLLQPRPQRVASRARRPRAPQGPRRGVPRGVAALAGRERAGLLPRRGRARQGARRAGPPRPCPRDPAPADLALGRYLAPMQRSAPVDGFSPRLRARPGPDRPSSSCMAGRATTPTTRTLVAAARPTAPR